MGGTRGSRANPGRRQGESVANAFQGVTRLGSSLLNLPTLVEALQAAPEEPSPPKMVARTLVDAAPPTLTGPLLEPPSADRGLIERTLGPLRLLSRYCRVHVEGATNVPDGPA